MTAVGIMSMQRIFNYGSSLQAYALRRMVETADPDAHVRFLDFAPGPPLLTSEDHGEPPRSRLGRTLAKVREYTAVDAPVADRLRFLNHKRSYATKYFPLVGIPQAPDRDLTVDLQIIGSDEVFNCVQSNTNVGYSRDLFGHGSPAGRLVTYAASFGNTTLAKIEQAGIRDDLAADLSRFEFLSVRDRNSAHVVEAITGRTPELHVDPVLAYDFASLEPRIPTTRLFAGKYIIVYGYAGRLDAEENRELRVYADRIGAKVLTLGGVQACGDRFVDCNPFEVLAYFRDAEAVVTDTFHGTIFSIINDVPFATLIRPSLGKAYGNEEKLSYLLEMFGLGSRRLGDATDLTRLLAERPDTGSVQGILDRERHRTSEYLARVVRDADRRHR